MAKIRHRVFEIYESRSEAIRALTPKLQKAATESSAPDSWEFQHLTVSRSAGVTLVEFADPKKFGEETADELREDFSQLADNLGIDSKVLVDFTGVDHFSAACVDSLVVFSQMLRTRGSRIALCSLAPAARESFFLPVNRNRL